MDTEHRDLGVRTWFAERPRQSALVTNAVVLIVVVAGFLLDDALHGSALVAFRIITASLFVVAVALDLTAWLRRKAPNSRPSRVS